MNVLMLTKHDLGSFGVAEVLRRLSHELVERGVGVCCYSNHASAKDQPWSEAVTCVQGPLPRPGKWWAHRAGLAELAKVVREHGIDLIHCHDVYRPGYAARLLKRRLGVPYVVTSHGDLNTSAAKRPQRPSGRRRCRAILRDADYVTHLGPTLADYAHSIEDTSGKERTIPNGVDVDWWSRPAPPPPSRYVLALGRFVASKGFADLIEAMAQLRRRGVAIGLVLAGAGDDESALRQRIATHRLPIAERLDALDGAGPGAVHFAGLVSGEAKRQLFRGALAVTMPSRSDSPEAMPMVLLEAMAAGRAVLSSDHPTAVPVIGHGEQGEIVPSATMHDPAAAGALWAEAIERLVREPTRRQAYERANVERARAYAWDRIVDAYLEVYRTVLATPAALPA